MSWDFTLNKYRELCQAMLQYRILRIVDTASRENLPGRYILLRHDIDRKPGNALAVARIEAELGIKSSYYFRMRRHTFKPGTVARIAEMGHEIGYHYEALDKAQGNYEKAIAIFQNELEQLRQICDVRTICPHGNPLTKWDNQSLWERYDFRDYGIVSEALATVNERVHYFTDTSRTWNWKHRRMDRVRNTPDGNLRDMNTTDDLIWMINSGALGTTHICTHPERWSKNPPEWATRLVVDKVMNLGKRASFVFYR